MVSFLGIINHSEKTTDQDQHDGVRQKDNKLHRAKNDEQRHPRHRWVGEKGQATASAPNRKQNDTEQRDDKADNNR